MNPVVVRAVRVVPAEAWQVRAGDVELRAAARWLGRQHAGIWGEDAPEQVVWIEGARPARVGDWIVKTPGGPLILSPEQFTDLYETVPET